MNDEPLDDLPEPEGYKAWEMSEALLKELQRLRDARGPNGRMWAIAATDAEKLHAWLGYTVSGVDDATD